MLPTSLSSASNLKPFSLSPSRSGRSAFILRIRPLIPQRAAYSSPWPSTIAELRSLASLPVSAPRAPGPALSPLRSPKTPPATPGSGSAQFEKHSLPCHSDPRAVPHSEPLNSSPSPRAQDLESRRGIHPSCSKRCATSRLPKGSQSANVLPRGSTPQKTPIDNHPSNPLASLAAFASASRTIAPDSLPRVCD